MTHTGPPPRGFGSPDDYRSEPANHNEFCPWCGWCLACNGAKPCTKGTDGMHYWPPRDEVTR